MQKDIKFYSNPDEYIEERTAQLKNVKETYKDYQHFPDFVERSLSRMELEQAKLYILANDILQNKATFDDLMDAILSLDFDTESEKLMERYGIILGRY